MSKRYQIRVMVNGEFRGYLTYRDRTSWCKRTALKHANESTYLHGWEWIIEEI